MNKYPTRMSADQPHCPACGADAVLRPTPLLREVVCRRGHRWQLISIFNPRPQRKEAP